MTSESAIQSTYLAWLKLQYPKVYEVTSSFPNSGVREPRYGARLKREGMKKGFPDLGIFWPSEPYHGMFIEFKSAKGVVRKEQKEVLEKLSANGYLCAIAKSLDEGINKTNSYLNRKPKI